MDTTRWETEALRPAKQEEPQHPKPSGKRRRPDARWVTLREAEEATGIPVNTLRKWVRRADLPSYLESDGDIALRMVDLDAVERRAADLGRDIHPIDRSPTEGPDRRDAPDEVPDRERPSDGVGRDPAEPPSADTMIVPIDAWDKMLAQLGNLHEAGQQLAEARERAAKAETEAAFLRSQLADLRSATAPPREIDRPERNRTPSAPPGSPEPSRPDPTPVATTTYWRVLRSRILGRGAGD